MAKLANQVMVAPYDNLPGEQQRLAMDQWSGYPAARDRLVRAIAERAPNRTVVLTGTSPATCPLEVCLGIADPAVNLAVAHRNVYILSPHLLV